jgi:hypothetical protein
VSGWRVPKAIHAIDVLWLASPQVDRSFKATIRGTWDFAKPFGKSHCHMSSSLNLDPSTLLFSISVLAMVMATVSFSAAGASPREQFGLSEWGIAMAAGAAGIAPYFIQQGPTSAVFIVARRPPVPI